MSSMSSSMTTDKLFSLLNFLFRFLQAVAKTYFFKAKVEKVHAHFTLVWRLVCGMIKFMQQKNFELGGANSQVYFSLEEILFEFPKLKIFHDFKI